MSRMEMPWDFARQLMDDLAELAIYANGRAPETDDEIELVETYAKRAFTDLLEAWESDDLKWNITEN